MKLNSIIAAAFILMSPMASRAVTITEFCEGFLSVNHQDSSATLPWFRALQVMVAPRSIVKPVKFDESVFTRGSSRPGVIYVNLQDPQINLSVHSKTLSNINEKRIAVAKLELYRGLQSVQDQASCEALVSKEPYQFKTIQEYLDLFTSNQELMEKVHQMKSRSLLIKKLNSFVRRGWKILFPAHHEQLSSMISSDSESQQIMLVSHADSLGRLYDASHSILPKGFFSNLPSSVSRVIQYSCFSKKVAEYYKVNELQGRLEYVYPKVNDSFSQVFSEQTPVMAIRGMMKLARLKVGVRSSQKSCSLKLNIKDLPNGMLVSLNDHVLGYSAANNDVHRFSNSLIPFYCDLLKSDKNLIKIFYLDSAMNQPIGEIQMSIIDESGKNHLLDVKEFLSSDRKRHLLTLGTLGGPL